jgi:serine protease Do
MPAPSHVLSKDEGKAEGMRLLLAITLACLLLTAPVRPVFAQEQHTFNRRTPIVEVYEKTYKAVVNISGESTVSASVWPELDWPDIFDFGGPRFRRQVQVKVLGSGVVVHEDGYIITNAHVIEGAKNIKIAFSDGHEFPATVLSADQSKDLAILTIETKDNLSLINLGRSNDLMVGETVIAIGNPYGYTNTVTSGVVSAVGRDIEVSQGFWMQGLIQTDAPINYGNSGGPLLNVNAELIGINTAIRPEAQNIGFAIPVDTLVGNLSQMLMPEKLRRVQLGLIMGRMKTVGEFSGLEVESVVKESPADKKGIAAGDIVLEIDGRKLTGIIDFYVKMMHKEVEEPIAIKYVRPKSLRPESQIVKLTLEARPLPDGRQLARKFFQMEISELTDAVARKFNFDRAYPILIITDLDRNGAADQAGLASGDLILQINNTTVRNLKELSLEAEKINEGDTVQLKIIRITLSNYGQVRKAFTVQLKAQSKKTSSSQFL